MTFTFPVMQSKMTNKPTYGKETSYPAQKEDPYWRRGDSHAQAWLDCWCNHGPWYIHTYLFCFTEDTHEKEHYMINPSSHFPMLPEISNTGNMETTDLKFVHLVFRLIRLCVGGVMEIIHSVGYRYNATQFITILQTALPWQCHNIVQP